MAQLRGSWLASDAHARWALGGRGTEDGQEGAHDPHPGGTEFAPELHLAHGRRPAQAADGRLGVAQALEHGDRRPVLALLDVPLRQIAGGLRGRGLRGGLNRGFNRGLRGGSDRGLNRGLRGWSDRGLKWRPERRRGE